MVSQPVPCIVYLHPWCWARKFNLSFWPYLFEGPWKCREPPMRNKLHLRLHQTHRWNWEWNSIQGLLLHLSCYRETCLQHGFHSCFEWKDFVKLLVTVEWQFSWESNFGNTWHYLLLRGTTVHCAFSWTWHKSSCLESIDFVVWQGSRCWTGFFTLQR